MRRGTLRVLTTVAIGSALSLGLFAQGQTPVFRAGVDLIAVDVQVVDGDGRPIPALRPQDFDVSISGKTRRVASAEFIESTRLDGSALNGSGSGAGQVTSIGGGPTASNIWPTGGLTGTGRMYVLAFDTDSFSVGESRDVVGAARGFIQRLQPADQVGLYTFPVGPRLEPTTDHGAVSKQVDTIVGHLQNMPGEFNLTPSEIIDVTAEIGRARANNVGRGAATPVLSGNEGEVTRRVQLRECGATDVSCVEQIQTEAQSLAFYLEGRATEGLNGLRSLIQLLNDEPGRKTVVLFSAGIASTDRPGGRPEIGDLAKQLGQDAAATNTTIYVVHLDAGPWRQMAAETRKTDNPPVSRSRDNAVTGRLLSEFSGASGGTLMRVVMGGGGWALDRVLRETSSHYLLGVEPADTDRDGKLRTLNVKVRQKGTTVRSRIWVVVPKRTL
ncbi:MAG: VWA domain-containing protein [Acidobacteriota bacterium]